MNGLAGVYRLEVGDFFYFGSTRRIGFRFSDHQRMLREGRHWIPELQLEFDGGGEVRLFLMREEPEKPNDRGNDHRDRLKMYEQKLLMDWFGKPGCVNRSSDSGYNSTISRVMKNKWADPEWRAATTERIRAGLVAKGPVSAETREKMAAAKRGARNINSRKCILWFDGKKLRFESATAAARHFEVSQQCMDLWLRGKVAWPGTGIRPPKRNARLIGLTGRYA